MAQHADEMLSVDGKGYLVPERRREPTSFAARFGERPFAKDLLQATSAKRRPGPLARYASCTSPTTA